MGSLVTAANAAYVDWKVANYPTDIAGWDALTDAQVSSLFRDDKKYLQAIQDAQSIETSFMDARTAAFAVLEAELVAARAALAQVWQAKEDNDFDVDFVPAE